MGLLNLGFAILIVKMVICILPGVLAILVIAMSEESKRELRNKVCSKLFGVSNAIPYPNFVRGITIIATIMILFSLTASWFLLLRSYFA